MPIVDDIGLPISSGGTLKRVAEWFEQLLKQNAISIAKPSQLHQDITDLKFLGDAFQGKTELPIDIDLSDFFRRTLGLEFIIKSIHKYYNRNHLQL